MNIYCLFFIVLDGIPTLMEKFEIFLVTTDDAPTTEPFPTFIPGRITTLVPIHTPFLFVLENVYNLIQCNLSYLQ